MSVPPSGLEHLSVGLEPDRAPGREEADAGGLPDSGR
jgi:hypothetical protein